MSIGGRAALLHLPRRLLALQKQGVQLGVQSVALQGGWGRVGGRWRGQLSAQRRLNACSTLGTHEPAGSTSPPTPPTPPQPTHTHAHTSSASCSSSLSSLEPPLSSMELLLLGLASLLLLLASLPLLPLRRVAMRGALRGAAASAVPAAAGAPRLVLEGVRC